MNLTPIVIVMMRVKPNNLKRKKGGIQMKKYSKAFLFINIMSIVKLLCTFLKKTAHYGDDFKAMYDTYSNLLVGIEPSDGRRFKVGDTKVRLFYNPLFFVIGGRCGSVACTVADSNGDCVIFTERSFHRLSPETQKFIICHEVGHIMNKDKAIPFIEQITRLILSMFCVSPKELAADKYAADKLGYYRKPLEELAKQFNRFSLARLEIIRRIKALDQASINRD